MANFNVGFQDASGIVLKRGHWLATGKGGEVLINESLGRALWPDGDPVGQLIHPAKDTAGWTPDHPGWTVAGVVGDLRATMRDPVGNMLYGREDWAPANFNTFVLRLSRDYDLTLVDAVRRRLYTFDPRIVVHQVLGVSEFRDNQLWMERMANSVLKVLAGIALLLTVVGIFSVLAYTVDRRMGEFGVRLALGATRRDLVGLVVQRGLGLTLTGIVLGIGGALALGRFLKALLFGTATYDPWVLAAVGLLLLLTSALACVVPARRAVKVDVSKLLRAE
jgi:putative ABC transport system permease protein